LVSDDELVRRRSELSPPMRIAAVSGYRRIFVDHVLQADSGCDFDFMVQRSAAVTADPTTAGDGA